MFRNKCWLFFLSWRVYIQEALGSNAAGCNTAGKCYGGGMSKITQKLIKCGADSQIYKEGLGLQERARCLEKLGFIGGADQCELAPSCWINDDP